MAGENGRVFASLRCCKAIAELGHQMFESRRIGMHIDLAAHELAERTKIVDAVGLIGMGMGHQHAVQMRDLGRQ